MSYGYALAVLMFFATAGSALFDCHTSILMQRLGARSRAALTTLIYAKSLRLSQPARVEFSDGYIVNLMQIDANRMANNNSTLHRTWTIPLKLVMCMSLLYVLIGPAALAGLGVMVVLAPGNYYAMKSMLKYTRNIQTMRDKRVKLLSEVLSGMKIVKLLGWEKEIDSQVESSRRSELDDVRLFKYLNVAVELLGRLSPLLLKISGFVVYVLTEDELTAAKAFTALGLFDILVGPVANFPKVIQVVTELTVSMERILNFMISDEVSVNTSIVAIEDTKLEVTSDEVSVSVATAAVEYSKLEASSGPEISPYTRLQTKVLPGTNTTAIEIAGGSFRWRQGKVALEEEKTKNEKEEKSVIKKLEVEPEGPGRVALEEKRLELAGIIEHLSKQLDLCEDSPLLPVQGPPTLRDVNLTIKRGSLTCILGPVGCGKSTLLSAMLNEVPLECGQVSVAGEVAYCNQEPYLLHASLKENILFGQSLDVPRYKMALEACALVQDIAQLSGNQGDETEIGEKGLNLSGGQKAGVSLARAVFANKDVYIIDDVLAAVDVAVAETMMEKCILGVLANKTRVLVTHRAARWFKECDQIVLMEGGDGTGHIIDVGTYDELVARGHEVRMGEPSTGRDRRESGDFAMTRTISDADDATGPTLLSRTLSDFGTSVVALHGSSENVFKRPDRNGAEEEVALTKKEDRETGAVKGKIWGLYCRLIEAKHGLVIIILLLIYQSCTAGSGYWMAYWTQTVGGSAIAGNITVVNATEFGGGLSRLDNLGFLGVYACFLFGYVGIAMMTTLLLVRRGLHLGEAIHNKALWRLMRAPMAYFDTTIKGRIINRFSNDLQKVDMELQGNMRMFVVTLVRAAISLCILVVTAPYILIVVVPLTGAYARTMQFYRASVRELQRLNSKGASPVYAMFAETLDGVATSRAYNRQESLLKKNVELLGAMLRPWYLRGIAGQWLNLRLQFMGSVVTCAAAVIAVFTYGGAKMDASKAGLVGFTLIHALDISNLLGGFINAFTSTEQCLVALERLNAMCEIDQEAAETVDGDPSPSMWPSSGMIQFNSVWMAYRTGLAPALRGVSFNVESGEKVGIVGRRGAGKSSILIALFRIVETGGNPAGDHGEIRIDGLPIQNMGLSTLRAGLSIIPQDPVLFTGTLRGNLDPTGTKTDAELQQAIEEVGLWDFVSSRNGQLDMTIEAKGENLACGQRQLFCLARALLRKAKILVLDEATANVDPLGDDMIQKKLRELNGVTMLTIAHRLDTIIDYDKVVVMSEGVVKECANPRQLAAKDGTIFSEMWGQYNLKAH